MKITVYLPDDLGAEVQAADFNVSAITQNALRDALAQRQIEKLRARVDKDTTSGHTALEIQEHLLGILGHAISAYETLSGVRADSAHDPVAVALDLDRLRHNEAERTMMLLRVVTWQS